MTPTEHQIRLARAIVERVIPENYKADLGYRIIGEKAALAAIIETTERSADEIERLREENALLKERGAKAIIAYHVAICSPKGVVPMEEFYDPMIAEKTETVVAEVRTALKGKAQ